MHRNYLFSYTVLNTGFRPRPAASFSSVLGRLLSRGAAGIEKAASVVPRLARHT
jgi:hypothetical protein